MLIIKKVNDPDFLIAFRVIHNGKRIDQFLKKRLAREYCQREFPNTPILYRSEEFPKWRIRCR